MSDHQWTEKDDIMVFYIYKFGFDGIPSRKDIAKKIGVTVGSLNYRVGNFKAIDGIGKANHYSALSEEVYNKYKKFSKSRLHTLAFTKNAYKIMPTYLLVWNPKRWHWWDELGDSFDKVGEYYVGNWSSGNNKSIRKGDRIFLIRLGKEPRGIVASGHALSSPEEGEHWDEGLGRTRKKARYVSIRLDTLLNPAREQILYRTQLNSGVLSKMNWDSRASGVRIPDDVAAALEVAWSRLIHKGVQPIPIAEPKAMEGIRTETVKYVRGRSRALRDQALVDAMGTCCVCKNDFSAVLNGKGVRVLQVHHRKQLAASAAPRVTRLKDLAVVCANCHMLIHMNPSRALPIETLQKMLKN